MRRVVITGMGITSCLGNDLDTVSAALREGRAGIRQGMLEGSNVNVVEELVDMIETQRAYEVNSKMISATDQMLQYANQNL